MYRLVNKFFLFSVLTGMAPLAASAADAAAKPATDGMAGYNPVLIGLVLLILVLLFVIGILGNVLRQLAMVYRDKFRAERKSHMAAKALMLAAVLSLPAGYAQAQEAAAEVAAAASPLISGIPRAEFYLLVGVIGLELLVILGLILSIRTIVRILANKPVKELAAQSETVTVTRRSFWDRFNNVVEIEKEQDIMLDHDYDGIKELDNSLPPWWKYGFYVTILISVVYLYYYHMGGNGPSSHQEYIAEVEKGEAEKAAYLAKSAGNVDENTVKLLDASGIASGENIFQTACAACHAKDGGGGVGPNLTDDYWMHGGSLSDIFKSIKYGWPDKGMKSWKDDFSPKQIAELTSYIKSLKGSTPASPKEKQGDLFIESNVTAADSTKVAALK